MSAGQVVIRLNVREDNDGSLYLEACYKTIPCGCEVVGNGTLQAPLDIKFCEKHASLNLDRGVNVARRRRMP